jgi:hypothetical protein
MNETKAVPGKCPWCRTENLVAEVDGVRCGVSFCGWDEQQLTIEE